MNIFLMVRSGRAASMTFALFLGVVLLSACASTPVAPNEALTDARDAIARAQQSDGRQYAGGELDEARDKLKMAEKAVDQEDMVEAKRLAREAEVMALLATARTQAAKTVEINRQMERDARALDEEMDRMGGQQ